MLYSVPFSHSAAECPAADKLRRKVISSYFVLEADSEQKVRELFHPMQPDIRSLTKWSDMRKGA